MSYTHQINSKTSAGLRNLGIVVSLIAALLSSTASPLVFDAVIAQNSAAQSATVQGTVQITTEDQAGLRRVIITTPQGAKIFVNLTDDMAAGDTVSGTVFAEVSGKTDAEKAASAADLGNYLVEIAGQKIPATGKTFELKIPAALLDGNLPVILRDMKDKEAAKVHLRVASQAYAPETKMKLPTYGQAGGFIEIGCPCNGQIAVSDYVKIGSNKILVLSESPRKIVAFNTSPEQGLKEIEVSERGQIAKGQMSILGIMLSVGKQTLLRGEKTTLTVEVTGLDGLREAMPLRLVNRTTNIMTMEPANMQDLTIKPEDVQGGRFTTRYTLTGIQVGAFHIEGTVIRRAETASAASTPKESKHGAFVTRTEISPTPTPSNESPVPPKPTGQRMESTNRLIAAAPFGPSPTPSPQLCNPGNNLIENGGFETGDWKDWSVSYGKRPGVFWSDTLPSGHPKPTIITASSPPLFRQGTNIAPYCGANMLRINDLMGGKHRTRVAKRITLKNDMSPCSRIQITWGAMLQEAGHAELVSPKFEIEVTRKKKGKLKRRESIYEFKADARDGLKAGWVNIGQFPKIPIYYKTETFTRSLMTFKKGDELEITLTVFDCSEGDHAGAAFLDCAEIIDSCSGDCPNPNKSPIPAPIIPNVFTPNEDGFNDVWSLSNVHNACNIHVDIFNRWGNLIFSNDADQLIGYSGDVVTLWNGRINFTRVPDGTYFYVLTLRNCSETKEFKGFFEVFHKLPCLTNTVASDDVEGKLHLLVKGKARRNWKEKVRASHGRSYAKWRRAKDKDISCYQTGKRLRKKWHCVARGRPCEK